MTETKQPSGQRVAYIRVSTADQNLDRQRETVGTVDREFADMASGKNRNDRPQFNEMMGYLRTGDTLVVSSIDRLARSVVDLFQIVEELQQRGVGVEFATENLRFSPGATDPRDELMLTLMGAFAQFERAIIRERQLEGIALAKAQGKYNGSPAAMTPEMVAQARQAIADGQPKAAVARELGVGRSTLYRYLAGTT